MLDDARKNKLMELFAEGVELDPAARSEFVGRVCGDDAELRAELADMLTVPADALETFLVSPAVRPDSGGGTPPEIPGYIDLEPVGEGGMSTVYRARQVSPVCRTVAIKALRPGMDSHQLLTRFDAERHALARMAHPGIAVVHDAGVDAQGRPFLAMEFVDGLPLTDYCREHDLELVACVELFLKVCDAVDHAHRRGVLHRDLKPTNVLVVHGDVPTAKVIDFGIAKSLEGPLGSESIHTLHGALLGTPEYMSPEQFAGDSRLVDTRSDVYALGAMLYEVLCGERPFDSERLRSVGLAELARIVRDESPPRPSTCLRRRGQGGGKPPTTLHWSRQLHSDLDWVAMKALEKDPERRYPSPRALAEDLRRFLSHQPIEAGPPSGYYRMRKFARRYRAQLAAAAGVVVALCLGLLSTLWFLFESRDNEARALASAREADGARLAATAALVTQRDPNLALLLAVEAGERTDDFSVHETILGALSQQNLAARLQHSDYGTTEARFLDDGRLLSCGIDPVFWLTDVDSGALVHRFVGHGDRVHDIALSPSQQLVASASLDGSARVWDLQTGACRLVLPHPDGVKQIAWTADGEVIGTLCEDGRVRLFAATDGAVLCTIDADARWFALAADGARVAAKAQDGVTTVWSADGDRLLEIPSETATDERGRVVRVGGEVAFGPAGDRFWLVDLRFGQRPRMRLYSVEGDMLAALDGAEPRGVAGDRLLLDQRGTFVAMSLRTGEVLERIRVDGITRLQSFAPDGRHAVGFDRQRDLCLVDLQLGQVTSGLAGENDKNHRNRDVAWHPDGARFAVSGRELLVWRLVAEYAPFRLPLDGDTQVVSLAAAGEALALLRAGEGRTARWSVWSIDARRKLRDLPLADLDELHLIRDGTALQGVRSRPVAAGEAARTEVVTFDLSGTEQSRVEVPCRHPLGSLRPEGDRCVCVEVDGVQRIAHFFDARTGAARGVVEHDAGWHVWGFGPDARYLGVQFGSRTRTDLFELHSGALITSVRGPTGASHYGLAIDEQRQRMVIVLGDLRARCYDLKNPAAGPTGEYSRLVRSDTYPSGVLPDGSLVWVLCSNEVHLFDPVTGRPFAVLPLAGNAQLAAARTTTRELITVADDGSCQRWPLDTGATARRLAHGSLTLRQRDLYRVGTVEARTAHEVQRLQANPTSRNLAALGEIAAARGDLDAAIDAYRRCCETGPLAPMDLRRYLRLLELLARRPVTSGTDLALAAMALREARRCGVRKAQLDALPGFAALAAHEQLRELLPR